jgi:hypothetical protein
MLRLVGTKKGRAVGTGCALLLAAGACGESGDQRDRAQWRAHADDADGGRGQRVIPGRAVRNGSIFVEQWNELAVKAFTLWRGGVDVPFQRLRGVRLPSAPCVSADGGRLAYIRTTQPEIVVRRISRVRDEVGPPRIIGRLPRGLTDVYGGCAWSSGGSAIVIAGSGLVGRRSVTTVWRIQADGTGLRELLRLKNALGGNAPGDPAWSSMGRIAFVNTSAEGAWVAMVDAHGANRSRLPWGHSPAWSPDGRQLAFIRSITGEYATIAPGPVLIANADGGDVRRFHRKRSSAVAFSPDGRSLAITGWAFPDQGPLYNTITITDTDGTTTRTLRLPAPHAVSTGVTWTRASGR